tara:strand:- start:648 stop:809 length:162 start_codon:yes stop_codon:yes gene_type:complete
MGLWNGLVEWACVKRRRDCFFAEAKEGVFSNGVAGGLVIEFVDGTIGACEWLV